MRNAAGPCLGSGHPPIARARGPRYIDPGDARGYPQRLSAGEGVTVDSLKGRVGVVTGGASGIGRAMVEAFAREGARVVVADLDEAGMAEVVGPIRSRGGEALAVRTDVTDLASVQALAERAFDAFGRVHVLCNNAGVALWGGLETATHRDWQWGLGVNLWGVVPGLEAFRPRMIAQKEPGHIVNTASMAGLVATRGLGIYNTSKNPVVGLSENLVKDLKPYNIGVSVLCPMGVSTNIRARERNRPANLKNDQPSEAEPVELMGRYLAPDTVAEMVLGAIRRSELYVITHDEGLEPLRSRFERMERTIRQRKP